MNQESDNGVAAFLAEARNAVLLHECGLVTAWLPRNTSAQNKKRSRALRAYLELRGYKTHGLTGKLVAGGEDGTDLHALFAADVRDKGVLRRELLRLGEILGQQAVLWIDKGGAAFWIGSDPSAVAGLTYNQLSPAVENPVSEGPRLPLAPGKSLRVTEAVANEPPGNVSGYATRHITSRPIHLVMPFQKGQAVAWRSNGGPRIRTGTVESVHFGNVRVLEEGRLVDVPVDSVNLKPAEQHQPAPPPREFFCPHCGNSLHMVLDRSATGA